MVTSANLRQGRHYCERRLDATGYRALFLRADLLRACGLWRRELIDLTRRSYDDKKGNKMEQHQMEHHLRTRYGALSQAFHWATAILVLIAFVYGPGGSEQQVYLPARDFNRQLHETLGMAVLALVVMRLLWRSVAARPHLAQPTRWMGIAAAAVQGALYLLLFALPLTAICGAWLEGHRLTLLAGIEVSSLLGVSHAAGATMAEIHTWLGDAILWLAGLHALAALYHHLVLKDGVLASMLPRWISLR